MNKFLIASAAVAALAIPALANAIELPNGTVTINGSVAANCVLSTDTNTITLNEMADAVTGAYNNVANGKSATLVGFCNGSRSTIQVQANPITESAVPAVTGFTDHVDYTATASVTPAGSESAVSASDTSVDALPGSATGVGLFSNTITVALSASSASAKLIAGDYTGTTVVTLSPAL